MSQFYSHYRPAINTDDSTTAAMPSSARSSDYIPYQKCGDFQWWVGGSQSLINIKWQNQIQKKPIFMLNQLVHLPVHHSLVSRRPIGGGRANWEEFQSIPIIQKSVKLTSLWGVCQYTLNLLLYSYYAHPQHHNQISSSNSWLKLYTVCRQWWAFANDLQICI